MYVNCINVVFLIKGYKEPEWQELSVSKHETLIIDLLGGKLKSFNIDHQSKNILMPF